MATSPAAKPSLAAAADADLQSARRVMEHARDGIAALSAGLGPSFLACLDLFAGISGRVIVSGVGKSGHVGRKIAATLASTGTPAFFVHAGEASHGDMGMIAKGDAVLAISNSGEAGELRDLVAYTRRFGIPLVAITSRPTSSLGQGADIVLALPPVGEACPLGLAPTTSTTMTLVLGDAIAVALLERRGFSADDYKIFHPGGQLGRRLFKVSELMHGADELPLVREATAMSEVLLVMTNKTFGVAGVTDGGGNLIGIVTDGDLRRHMQRGSNDLFAMRAADVMTRTPKTIRPTVLAAEALRRMNEAKITSIFVVEDDKPVGILRMHDILRAGAG
jgi:arabinose-5-phosphate isomerase